MSTTKPSGAPFNEFSRALPGTSLMYEIGSQPYDSTVLPREDQNAQDALSEIQDMFTSSVVEKENMDNIISLLKAGKSPQLLAKQYLMSLNMTGHIQTDFSELSIPNIAMQIGAIGEYSGIKMNLEEGKDSAVNEVELNTILANKDKEDEKNKFESAVQDYEDRISPTVTKEEEVTEDKKPLGLMSRAVLEDEDILDMDANNEVLV